MIKYELPTVSSLDQESLEQLGYERAKVWAKIFSDIDMNEKVDEAIENMDDTLLDTVDGEHWSTADEAVESHVEDDCSILQDISNWTRINNTKAGNGKGHVVPTEDGDNQEATIQELLNQTRPIVQECERKWKEAGLDRVLDTFDAEQIEREVGGYLRRNRSDKRIQQQTDSGSHCSDTESLHSWDTAQYIRTSRNRIAERKQHFSSTVSIKAFRKKQKLRIERRRDGHSEHEHGADVPSSSGRCTDSACVSKSSISASSSSSSSSSTTDEEPYQVNEICYTTQRTTRSKTTQKVAKTVTATKCITSFIDCKKPKKYDDAKGYERHKKRNKIKFQRFLKAQEENFGKGKIKKRNLMNDSHLINESTDSDSDCSAELVKLKTKQKVKTKRKVAQTQIGRRENKIACKTADPTKLRRGKYTAAKTLSNVKLKEASSADTACSTEVTIPETNADSDDVEQTFQRELALAIELSKKVYQHEQKKEAVLPIDIQTATPANNCKKRINNIETNTPNTHKKTKPTSNIKESAAMPLIIFDTASSSSKMSSDTVDFSSGSTDSSEYVALARRDRRKRQTTPYLPKKYACNVGTQMRCNSTALNEDRTAKWQFGELSPIQEASICAIKPAPKLPNKYIEREHLIQTSTKSVDTIKYSPAAPTPTLSINGTNPPNRSNDKTMTAQICVQQTPKQSVNGCKNYILVYTPKQKDLAAPDGYFNISQQHLSSTLGEKLAGKFMKYHVGPRRFPSTSKVYYCPSRSPPSSDTGSEDDELERLGRYGELYESRQSQSE